MQRRKAAKLLTIKSSLCALASLREHLSSARADAHRQAVRLPYNRIRPPRNFINRIEAELGAVKSAGPLGLSFRSKFVPYHLELRGTATVRVASESDSHWVTIEISGHEPDCEIDHIRCDY